MSTADAALLLEIACLKEQLRLANLESDVLKSGLVVSSAVAAAAEGAVVVPTGVEETLEGLRRRAAEDKKHIGRYTPYIRRVSKG